ncbi:MAG TPA: DUF2934 domain-containing protein [Terriglobales bacterium]|nr:DUF2934 domain-containing protein [Terriglobales bacterium]HXY13319.1 DUF2934 domain-containing protein [Terriglobales bacterium]
MPRAKTARSTSPNKQVISMPEATSTLVTRKTGGSLDPTSIDLEAQIRLRAYELYEERGGTPGLETEDWFRAEREVLARHNHQQTA